MEVKQCGYAPGKSVAAGDTVKLLGLPKAMWYRQGAGNPPRHRRRPGMVKIHWIMHEHEWVISSEPHTIQLAGGVQRLDGGGGWVSALP